MVNFNRVIPLIYKRIEIDKNTTIQCLYTSGIFWTQHGQHRLHTIGEIRLKYT